MNVYLYREDETREDLGEVITKLFKKEEDAKRFLKYRLVNEYKKLYKVRKIEQVKGMTYVFTNDGYTIEIEIRKMELNQEGQKWLKNGTQKF